LGVYIYVRQIWPEPEENLFKEIEVTVV